MDFNSGLETTHALLNCVLFQLSHGATLTEFGQLGLSKHVPSITLNLPSLTVYEGILLQIDHRSSLQSDYQTGQLEARSIGKRGFNN